MIARKVGPQCQTRHFSSVFDGTSARSASPKPGSVGRKAIHERSKLLCRVQPEHKISHFFYTVAYASARLETTRVQETQEKKKVYAGKAGALEVPTGPPIVEVFLEDEGKVRGLALERTKTLIAEYLLRVRESGTAASKYLKEKEDERAHNLEELRGKFTNADERNKTIQKHLDIEIAVVQTFASAGKISATVLELIGAGKILGLAYTGVEVVQEAENKPILIVGAKEVAKKVTEHIAEHKLEQLSEYSEKMAWQAWRQGISSGKWHAAAVRAENFERFSIGTHKLAGKVGWGFGAYDIVESLKKSYEAWKHALSE